MRRKDPTIIASVWAAAWLADVWRGFICRVRGHKWTVHSSGSISTEPFCDRCGVWDHRLSVNVPHPFNAEWATARMLSAARPFIERASFARSIDEDIDEMDWPQVLDEK